MRTPLSEKPLVSLAGLDWIAHRLNLAVFDCFFGNETNMGLSLRLVSIQQRVVGPTGEYEIELPCQIVAVADTRAHALTEERRHLVCRITREKYASVSPLLD